jgi:hypothetical protein
MTKLHWTQTPEGKAKMSVSQKKAWATRKNGNAPTKAHKIVKKAVAQEKNGQRPAINGILKMLKARRDALTTAIAILQEETRRG